MIVTYWSEAVSAIIPMAMFAFATSASPGPVNIVSAMSGARYGAMKSFPYVFGATFGFVTILLSVGSGLGVIVLERPLLSKALAIMGSIYMLYLAYQIAKAPATSPDPDAVYAPPTLIAGAITQAVNPKAWVVSLSAVSLYVSNSSHYAGFLVLLSAIFFGICLASLWAWSFAGASLARRTGGIRKFNIAMSVVLAISVTFFLIDIL